MSRPAIHFLVDVLLLVGFLALLWTSALTQFIFPAPARTDGWLLWGLNFETWCFLRFASLAVFTLCVLVHLILQWSWVCKFVASRLFRRDNRVANLTDGIKTLYGVGTLIGVLSTLGVLLAIAEITIQHP